MKRIPDFSKWFADTRIGDIPLVGGKNASLGERYRALTLKAAACGGSMKHHE
jgi:phosphoenolpyruvate synthase/pyruvate phosphate dikinase